MPCAEMDLDRTHCLSAFWFSFRRHRWQAISPIVVDVTFPWFICLSVCL